MLGQTFLQSAVDRAMVFPVFPTWITNTYRRNRLERIIRSRFVTWRSKFPQWVNAGFDEYFLLHDAMPLLDGTVTCFESLDPALLAQRWAKAYHIPAERIPQAIAELTPIAEDFLAYLRHEYNAD